MVAYYVEIKWLHIACVLLSGTLFFARGVLAMTGARAANHAALRYLSYAIDTTLLTAALMLLTMLHLNPFTTAWLAVKLAALVAYIVLGVLALRRARTRSTRLIAFVAALLVFGFMISVARTHDPLGVFSAL